MAAQRSGGSISKLKESARNALNELSSTASGSTPGSTTAGSSSKTGTESESTKADAEKMKFFISNSTEYVAARGFPLNSFSVNGIVRESTDLNNGLMQLLGREQYMLAQLVQMGKVWGTCALQRFYTVVVYICFVVHRI